MDIFNAEEANRRKEEGMALAAAARSDQLEFARNIAKEIALKSGGLCDADKVQAVLIPMGISLGNAAGSIFRGKCWVWTGEWVLSERKISHANPLRVWRYVEVLE